MEKKISIKQARQIALSSQGLLQKAPFGTGKQGALSAIEHLSYVQIDTISVVERAHHHTLWSRVPEYEPKFLDQLMEERKIFEYWSHAAAFLPIADYRFALRRMRSIASGERHWFPRTKENERWMKLVLARITEEGALRSKDFLAPQKVSGGWFEWKPAKKALEQLFMQGALSISSRKGFQKTFDLTERVIPSTVLTKPPTEKEFVKYLIRSALRSHGIVRKTECIYLRRGLNKISSQALAEMIEAKELLPVTIEGMASDVFFIDPRQTPTQLGVRWKILSPFDNAVIQRKRLKDLFGFEYVIECYVPLHKRKFGYFSLPLLYRTEFVGLIDMKAHRANRKLEIISLHFMVPMNSKSKFDSLKEQIQSFVTFNKCDTYYLNKSIPASLRSALCP